MAKTTTSSNQSHLSPSSLNTRASSLPALSSNAEKGEEEVKEKTVSEDVDGQTGQEESSTALKSALATLTSRYAELQLRSSSIASQLDHQMKANAEIKNLIVQSAVIGGRSGSDEDEVRISVFLGIFIFFVSRTRID
jgi:hypothetical protein